jgi:hypothetical protein
MPNEEVSLSGTHSGSNAIKRYWGCVILMHLPEKGVDEAFEWLTDAWRFYAHPAIPSGQNMTTSTPAHATSGKLIAQSPLVIAED